MLRCACAAGNPGWTSPFAQSTATAFANAAAQNSNAAASAFASAASSARFFLDIFNADIQC